MIRTRQGEIVKIIKRWPGVTEIAVDIDGREEKAISYDNLTGSVEVGDLVALNTTAVFNSLGTGGYHFVCSVNCGANTEAAKSGHIMKVRYTPSQVKVYAVEEEDHPLHGRYRDVKDLCGMPVAVASLHSLVAPVAAAARKTGGAGMAIAYVMTDGGALPIWLSRLVNDLRDKGLINLTVTCGHAFGGDLEAINIYSGLLAARAAGADIAVTAMGPGIVGSATEFGHTGIEQGEIINAVNVLGGRAVAVPRISFADPRERHRGVSHHTLTAVGKVAATPCTLVLPALGREEEILVLRQLNSAGIDKKHRLEIMDSGNVDDLMGMFGLDGVTTMGRNVRQDPAFFMAGAAAGAYVAELALKREVQS